MKKFVLGLMLVGALAAGDRAQSADLDVDVGAKAVIFKGRATCLKNGLKEDDYCKTIIIAEKNGVPIKYWVANNKVGELFHPEICANAKFVRVQGTTRKIGDRWELTPTKITLD
jgi:hypothetical protein